jgi:hypothetical protein
MVEPPIQNFVAGDENEYLGFPIFRLFTDLKLVN